MYYILLLLLFVLQVLLFVHQYKFIIHMIIALLLMTILCTTCSKYHIIITLYFLQMWWYYNTVFVSLIFIIYFYTVMFFYIILFDLVMIYTVTPCGRNIKITNYFYKIMFTIFLFTHTKIVCKFYNKQIYLHFIKSNFNYIFTNWKCGAIILHISFSKILLFFHLFLPIDIVYLNQKYYSLYLIRHLIR